MSKTKVWFPFAFLIAAGLLLLLANPQTSTVYSVVGRQSINKNGQGLGSTDWDAITISDDRIQWAPCYTDLQCARLKVPLNYSDPTGASGVIALTRIPSPLLHTAAYKGPIIFNPGGPGFSGVSLVVNAGKALSQLVGPHFDVVSFDPRGIGLSTPRASFFDSDIERKLWGSPPFTVLNASVDGVHRAWARAQIIGRLVEKQDSSGFEHLTTENTARDMLRIVEAHGQKKISYWGLSYGTILGATFATLFPDRIERFILDGVLDAKDYFAVRWSKSLRDTDKTLQAFFDQCAASSPEGCPFYESSAEKIKQKLDALTEFIYHHPVPVVTETSYGLVDYERLRRTIFLSLYSPYTEFPRLARGLADLARGNGTTLYRMSEEPVPKCDCHQRYETQPVLDGQFSILCTDGEEVRDTAEEFKSYVDELLTSSQWGDLWATIRTGCLAWPKQSKKHFRGPFAANTSHPILWIGNTADPVTPVSLAHHMAQSFPKSVVLTQDSPGHCSISAPSSCTQKYIHRYLLHGELPPEGVTCAVDVPMFPPKKATSPMASEAQSFHSVAASMDVDTLGAMGRLHRSLFSKL
ncbi:hypothetical protein ONZ45_g6288 [Pleurotus djamor]|nr:hypothetical protein ONZ45_g6288 [Pleurotus djamor]